MLEEMLEHLRMAREDPDVRVLVISSNDQMGLSAGADVREELDEEGRVRRMELLAQFYDELTAFPQPTIAACHGACVGGGAELAIACDLRVGGSNLRLRFPGAALGVPVGPARLVTLVGLSVAKYALLTAQGDRGRRSPPLGPRPQGRAGRVDRGGGAEDGRGHRRARPRGRCPTEGDAPEHDGVVERSAAEGRWPGGVAAHRAGPALPRLRAPLRTH